MSSLVLPLVRRPWALARALAGLALGLLVIASSDAAPVQKQFASPESAVTALVEALKANDQAAALAILGPGTEQWIRSGDPVADRATREKFAAAYEQKHTIAKVRDDRATLLIGADDWPFAFPLVRTGAEWRFDTAAGKTELLNRRIGQNELDTINVMLAIVDAQRDYAAEDRNRDGVREYARAFMSTPGRHDGLYWETAAGEPPSPLGPLVTNAAKEGWQPKSGPTPYHGYYYRMLSGQGHHAKGGALDYLVRGYMIGGFAVVAWPAQYGNSGVMTFIVNHDGQVFQRDLGAATATEAAKMTRFDPAPGWKPVATD